MEEVTLEVVELDIWTTECDALCIPTNGILKKNGSLVMGAGVAKQAAEMFPSLPDTLGRCVNGGGNHVYTFTINRLPNNPLKFFTFPTKNHWKDPADLDLIVRSVHELNGSIESEFRYRDVTILLPAPGCGLGGLDWQKEVKPRIEDILDPRVTIVTNPYHKTIPEIYEGYQSKPYQDGYLNIAMRTPPVYEEHLDFSVGQEDARGDIELYGNG